MQVALDAYLAEPGRSAETLGFSAASHTEVSLSLLVSPGRYALAVEPGPVGRTVIELGQGRSLSYVTMALFLLTDGESRLAVLVGRQRYPSQRYFVEVMTPDSEHGEAFLAELRRLMAERNVYRRKAISLRAGRGRWARAST